MENPYTTVIICTMGTPALVLKCLEEQTFKDFEIIIASEKGIVNAMNNALAKATGTIFVRVDDDVDIPSHWLQELIKPFSEAIVAGVTGPTYVPMARRKNRDSIRIWEKPNWFLRWLTGCDKFRPAGIYKCGMVSYDSNYAERFDNHAPEFQPDHLEGTNWAMRTDLIRKVGGFDPKFDGVAEWFDTDVEFKIKKLGYSLRYCPKAYLWHWLEFSANYNERFDGKGRIKNWILFHSRHSKFHYKKVIFLFVWCLYFLQVVVKKCLR